MSRRGYVPLYKKQKAFLTRLYNLNKVRCVNDMSLSHYAELTKMHDTETLWQDANRFLNDLHFCSTNGIKQ